jgi:hypothetical protein
MTQHQCPQLHEEEWVGVGSKRGTQNLGLEPMPITWTKSRVKMEVVEESL